MTDFKKQGKRNKRNGLLFEKRVKDDLKKEGWKVSKWNNNVEFKKDTIPQKNSPYDEEILVGECSTSKPSKFRLMQTGFPDFIAYKQVRVEGKSLTVGRFGGPAKLYEIIFVECKTKGYLSKEEKDKAVWYLKKSYCSKFFVAKKTKQGRSVVVEYKEVTEQ